MTIARRILMVVLVVTLVLVGRSSEARAQQTGEISVCSDPGIQTDPVSTISINGNSQDGVIVAWLNGNDNSYYAQKLDMLGRPLWGPCGFRVAGAIEPQSAQFIQPQIASNYSGDAIFAYVTRVGNFRQVFATVIHWDPAFDAPRLPVQLSTIPGSDSGHVRMTPSGDGFIVTWYTYESNSPSQFPYNIYAQKLNRSAQKLWGYDEKVVCDQDDVQINPEILADGHGGVFVTFLDQRLQYFRFDLFAQRLDADGNRLWEEGGKLIYLQATDDSEQGELKEGGDPRVVLLPTFYNHKMVMSGGGFIVTHPRRVSLGILAEGVNGDGDVLWTRMLGPHYSVEMNPLIISDGNNGAGIVWEQLLSPYDKYHIFAGRIDQNGNTVWPGRRISEFTSAAGYGKYLPSPAIPNAIVLQASTGNLVIPWLTDNSAAGDVLNANLVTLSSGCSLLNPPFAVSTGAIPAPPMVSVNVLGPRRLMVYEKAGDIFARFIPSPAFPGPACPDK